MHALLPVLFLALPLPALAVAAARAVRALREEEEEMTPEQAGPPGAVEYKILRSATGAFRSPAKFRAALAEEARAGWELAEKLDDSRLRLRRGVEWRGRDAGLAQDPYRTRYGTGNGAIALAAAVGTLLAIAAVVAMLVAIDRLARH